MLISWPGRSALASRPGPPGNARRQRRPAGALPYRTGNAFSSSPFPIVYQTFELAPSESANPVTLGSFQVAADPGSPGACAVGTAATVASPPTSTISL
jgi:hypothetical protein